MSKIIDNAKTATLWVDLIYEMIKNRFKLNEDIDNNYEICQKISRQVVEASNINLKVEGKENIPKDGSVLIASNHRSFFDILVLLASIDRTMSFVVAQELCKYPILKKYIESIECIPVNRNETDFAKVKKQLADMSEGLQKGGLILFPEGECNYFENEIGEFKKGGFMGVSSSNASIVPTYINVEKVKNLGRWVIPVEQVTVTFGKSYKITDIAEKKLKADALAEYTRNKVLELQKTNKKI